MKRLAHRITIDVIHLDVNFERYTPDGALRHASLSRGPGREVNVEAAYAVATVTAGIPAWDAPRTCRMCLN